MNTPLLHARFAVKGDIGEEDDLTQVIRRCAPSVVVAEEIVQYLQLVHLGAAPATERRDVGLTLRPVGS